MTHLIRGPVCNTPRRISLDLSEGTSPYDLGMNDMQRDYSYVAEYTERLSNGEWQRGTYVGGIIAETPLEAMETLTTGDRKLPWDRISTDDDFTITLSRDPIVVQGE